MGGCCQSILGTFAHRLSKSKCCLVASSNTWRTTSPRSATTHCVALPSIDRGGKPEVLSSMQGASINVSIWRVLVPEAMIIKSVKDETSRTSNIKIPRPPFLSKSWPIQQANSKLDCFAPNAFPPLCVNLRIPFTFVKLIHFLSDALRNPFLWSGPISNIRR